MKKASIGSNSRQAYVKPGKFCDKNTLYSIYKFLTPQEIFWEF
jgi:hypothetical protein